MPAEIADDMEALSEDLLMAGAYDDTQQVTRPWPPVRRRSRPSDATPAGTRSISWASRSRCGKRSQSSATSTTTPGKTIRSIVTNRSARPASTRFGRRSPWKTRRVASTRASETIVGFGKAAISRLAPLIGDTRWFAQRAGATLLGTIGSADVVPLLQPLLRKSDPRVTQAAVAALGKVDDPSAARAVQTVLRAATGSTRRAVVDALVVDRDPRVVPMLTRIVAESEPLGKDHDVVLETIDALATVGSDQAVPTLAGLAGLRRWFGGKKLRALKEQSVDAMVTIGGEKAAAALDEAAKTGDRGLKKIVAAKRR